MQIRERAAYEATNLGYSDERQILSIEESRATQGRWRGYTPLHPNLEFIREIATKIGIDYFQILQKYLEARRTGNQEIDKVRDEASIHITLLMRQVEGACSQLRGIMGGKWNEGIGRAKENLGKVINFDSVRRGTGRETIIQVPYTNHFRGRTEDGKSHPPYGNDPRNPYDGLRTDDLLAYYNPAVPVNIYCGEEEIREDQKLATYNPDGTLDLVKP